MEQTGYHVLLEPDLKAGYVAVVPAFPSRHSQRETAGEALAAVREAMLPTIEHMRERNAIPDLARELIRVASATDPKSAALDYTENPPRPDEFSAEEETLDWEGEGWS